MALNKNKKEELYSGLHEKLQKATAIVLTENTALKVADSDNLRQRLRKIGCEYKVSKNTIVKLAVKGTPAEALLDHFKGQKAMAISYGDPIAMVKLMLEFVKTNESVKITGGMLSGKYIDVASIEALSKLPSREVLLSKLLSVFVAVPTNFVGVLAAVPRKLLYLLKAIEEKKNN